MGAVRDHGRDLGLRERLDVLLGERLEQVLVPDPPSRVAGAELPRPEDRERHARAIEDPDHRPRDRLGPVVERGRRTPPSTGTRARVRPRRSRARRVPRPSRRAMPGAGPGVVRRLEVPQHRRGLGGNRDSAITRLRRRSTIVSTCSMSTGHSCMHAPHVVQAQTTSSSTTSGTSGTGSTSPSRRESPRAAAGPLEQVVAQVHHEELRREGLPVFHAGQAAWQRPHSVQAYRSRTSFLVRSAIVAAPR